jgi:hypothetical protein
VTGAAVDLPISVLDGLRRRTHRSLVAGVALGSIGHIAASTVSTIAAWSPSARWPPGASAMVPKRALDTSTAERFRDLLRSVGLFEQPGRWTNFLRGIGVGALVLVGFAAVVVVLSSGQP